MKSSVAAVLLLVGAVCGQWNNWNAATSNSVDLAKQFQSMDDNGNAQFGYSHPGQSSVTHRDAQGGQRGSYAYIDPEGREIRVSYIADEQGYRIVSNDQVNVAQPIRAANIAPVAGNFLQETPEVAAARAAHMAALNAALANARASGNVDDGSWQAEAAPQQQRWTAPAPVQQNWNAPAQQTWNAPAQQTWTAPVQQNWATPQRWDMPQPVQDTPEVAAAKIQFQQAFQQAAALAASQPE